MGTTHKGARVAAGAVKSRESTPDARISLLVHSKLRDRIDALAKSERRTRNAQCALLLERGLDEFARATG